MSPAAPPVPNPFRVLPKHASCELTRRCNFQCPFCYADCGRGSQRSRGEIPAAEWLALIDALLTRGVTSLTFTGGEALLKPGIERILRGAAAHPAQPALSLYTNGSLLTEKHLRLCRRWGIRLLYSLPGLRTFKAHTRGGADVFRLLATMERAHQLGIATACGITVTQKNQGELRDLIAAAVLTGAQTIQVIPVVAEGRARRHPELLLDYPESQAILAVTREFARRTGVRITGRGELFCSCDPRAARPRLLPADYAVPVCHSELDSISLDAAGFVHKCLHTPGRIGYWRAFLASYPTVQRRSGSGPNAVAAAACSSSVSAKHSAIGALVQPE